MTQWTESLWGDEGFSAMAIQNSFLETMGIVMRDTAPPAFYVLGWVWGKMFGYSEVTLRSLTLLLMLGAAVFAGLTVYQIGKSKLNGVLVFLMAISAPFLVPFAFEWRMYALLTFSVMGSVYFFVAKKWWGYVVLTALMLYTHHFGLFTFMAEGVVFLFSELKWRKPKTYLRQLWPFLVVVGLYLPWLFPFYLQLKRVSGGGFWLSVPKLYEVKDLLIRFATGGIKKEWQLLVKVLVVAVLAAKDWKKVYKMWVGVGIIYLAPVGLAYLVSYLVTPIFYDRYLLSVVMGMMVLIGVGTRKKFAVVMVAMIVLMGWQSASQFTHPSKRPFREMAEVIKAEKKQEDFLLNYNGRSHHLWESKYYGVPAPIYTPDGPLPLYVGTAQMTEADTVEKLPSIKGILGVIASEPVEEIKIEGYQLIEDKQFGELTFSWWKKSK